MRLPVFKVAAAAAIIAVLAGVGGVYMNSRASGNGLKAANANCADPAKQAAALKPHIKGQVAALVAANPPRVIDGFAFKGPDGKDMKLADFKGKMVLLNLWATWCIPCRTEMPELNALQKDEAKAGNFEVVAINIDTGGDEKPLAFRKDNGIDALSFYRDNTMVAFNLAKKQGLALGLPATMVIDRQGCLVASMNGPAAWDSNDAKAFLKAADKFSASRI